MPLGDSLTEGYPQMTGGYRIHLWNQLTASNIHATFVGSMTDGMEWAQPQHEGHSGWKIADLHYHVGNWLSTYQPEIILLLIGTNDILNGQHDGMPERYGALIDHIFAVKPDVRLVVSHIPPIGSNILNARVEAFNAHLPRIVSNRAHVGQRISLVDLYAPFTYTDLLDGVHLTDSAYPRMADVWFAELKLLIQSPVQPLAPVAYERIHSPFYTFTWTQSANPAATYKLKIKDMAGLYKHVEKGISSAVCSGGICRIMMTFPVPLPNRTTLRWKIATDGQSSAWRPFITDMPGTPDLMKPLNGSVLEPSTPRFVWSPIPDAAQMQLIIDQINLPDDQGGMNGKLRVVNVTFTSESTPSLTDVCDPGAKRCSIRLGKLGIAALPVGDYRWSIKTRSSFGKGRSEKWRFSIRRDVVRYPTDPEDLIPLPLTITP